MQPIIVENIVQNYRTKKTVVERLKAFRLPSTGERYSASSGLMARAKPRCSAFSLPSCWPKAAKQLVDGFDVVKDYKQIRNRIGYMPGRFSLYQDLSVQENLEFFATIFNTSIEENYDLIKEIYIQIEPFKDRKAGALSGGMKQKLALCCALIHKPSVLFLDEPTTGVDAVSRKEFWEMLHRLKLQDITILVSTAYMDEASLCDRVALIQKGELLSVDTPKAIISQFKKPLWAIRADEMYKLMNAINADPSVESCYPFGQYHHVVFKTQESRRHTLEDIAKKGNYANVEIKPIEPNIEDCFMALMNT
jgi:ABC-2 type transport system ATP-binding protein